MIYKTEHEIRFTKLSTPFGITAVRRSLVFDMKNEKFLKQNMSYDLFLDYKQNTGYDLFLE